jgi:predicted ArsR family transcriptional regulator
MHPVDEQLAGLASLGDQVRRGLYRFVVEQARPVGRDEAATAVGVSRSLAAYHLDRLVEEGLLEARFARLGTRRGPGAGRPSKLYARSSRQFAVHLPPRNYELAARLMAEALEATGDTEVRRRALATARAVGREAAARPDDASSRAGRRRRLLAVMRDCGYEPADDDGTITLRNCPFDALAREHRELVCAMNLALVEGLVAGAGCDDVEAVLEPRPDRCCVAVRPARS